MESKEGAEDSVWGTVTRWEPGSLVAFTWHPGQGDAAASHVTVTFEETDGKTWCTLEHAGWEIFGDQAAQAREKYDHGWPVVLGRFVELAGHGVSEDTWVALFHRPADPAVAGGVFADPRLGDHVAFLERMAEAGYLVAAGPLPTDPARGWRSCGCPVRTGSRRRPVSPPRTTPAWRGGFFIAEVRSWRVVMHA